MAVGLAQALPRARTEPLAASRPNSVLVLTSIASFMVALDALVVTTALSTIRIDLGAPLDALEWTVNAYNLSFAVLLLTGAALGDRFGRRRVFVIGIALFTLASAACALSPSITWLIVARAVQGAGGALVMPLAMALLGEAFPGEGRARALGLFSGFTGLALLGGPVVGGAIVQGGSWHWIFWLNVPVGLVTIALAAGRIRESFGARVALDVMGLVLASVASLALVWGLVRVTAGGWASPEVVLSLAAGLTFLVAFVVWETRAPRPMIPLRLFTSRAFAAGNAACFLFTAALYGTLFFVAQFLQTGQGHSPLSTGLRLLPWTGTLFIFAPLAGRLVNRFGERPLVAGGLLLQTIGMAWVAAVVSPETGFLALAVPFVLAGIGVSLAMPAAQNAVISAVAPLELGKASGTYSTLRFLGGAFGIAIGATAFGLEGSFSSPEQFSVGFATAVGVSAALSLLGAVAGLFVPTRRTS